MPRVVRFSELKKICRHWIKTGGGLCTHKNNSCSKPDSIYVGGVCKAKNCPVWKVWDI